MWKGTLTVGLLNIPVAAFTATDAASDVSMNQLHKDCGNRINTPKVCKSCDKELTTADIVKGYENAPGVYVQITEEELAAIKPPSTHTLSVNSFTPLSEIDLIYYDKPYFLSPNGPVAVAAYAALRDALKRTKRVALGVVTMHGRDHLMAIRPEEKGLVMQRMRERREVRSMDGLPGYAELPATASPNHVAMTEQIIESMEADFDPTMHEDSYRAELVKLIQAKVEGGTYTAPAAPPAPAPQDIMSALAATLEQAKSAKMGRPKKAAKVEEVAVPAKAKGKKKVA
jgi:DNA end-binding protein Ku